MIQCVCHEREKGTAAAAQAADYACTLIETHNGAHAADASQSGSTSSGQLAAGARTPP